MINTVKKLMQVFLVAALLGGPAVFFDFQEPWWMSEADINLT